MRAVLLTFCALAMAGCSSSGKLMTLASDDGPEEFAIVPTRPLELPTDLAQLPAPTPLARPRTLAAFLARRTRLGCAGGRSPGMDLSISDALLAPPPLLLQKRPRQLK